MAGGFDRTTGEDGKTVSDFGGMARKTEKTAVSSERRLPWLDWAFLLLLLLVLPMAARTRVITALGMFWGTRLPFSSYVSSVVFSVLLAGAALFVSLAGRKAARLAGLGVALISFLLGLAGMSAPSFYYMFDALFNKYGFETRSGLSFLQRFGMVYAALVGLAWLLRDRKDDRNSYRKRTALLSLAPVCLLFLGDGMTQSMPVLIGPVLFLYLVIWGLALKMESRNPEKKGLAWAAAVLSVLLILGYASVFQYQFWTTLLLLAIYTGGSAGVFWGICKWRDRE